MSYLHGSAHLPNLLAILKIARKLDQNVRVRLSVKPYLLAEVQEKLKGACQFCIRQDLAVLETPQKLNQHMNLALEQTSVSVQETTIDHGDNLKSGSSLPFGKWEALIMQRTFSKTHAFYMRFDSLL